ncbi:MAG: hypothetical protein EOM50_00930 [Erysipelotrichia bacterium]|nr:hypothetical protein [Erysipelotrichia bacterium]NCC54337.1 hypothetical protein [Erysipelotrichia bacterium]
MNNLFLFAMFFIVFVLIVTFSILYIQRKDARLLLLDIGFILLAISWYFIFDESISLSAYLMWFTCLSLLSIIIVLSYLYTERKSMLSLLIAILLSAFWLFTFCTEDGSVRLAIALKGHPKVAYTTALVENRHMRTKDISYYISQELIHTENGTLSFFECHNLGFLKISQYCEK